MARIVGQNQNIAKFSDHLSGGDIELYYRHPTTEERVAYSNQSIRREGDRLVSHKTEARLQFGRAILTGIRPGDFQNLKGEDIASTPGDPGFCENWPDLVMEAGADLVEMLAAQVFDVPCSVKLGEASASGN